jgi:uncharacterized protein (DUF58 family)
VTFSSFDPLVLARISGLALRARYVVEGLISGLHRSPYQGHSVEFAEHREYTPGDEIRHVDWKVYGRQDRFFVKRFEEETNLRAVIMVDCSASMSFGTSGMAKYDYAATLATSLAYLLLRQRDAVGLILFRGSVAEYVPPRANPDHLHRIVSALDRGVPSGETDLARVVEEASGKLRRRGLIVVISDLLEEPSTVIRGLVRFRHRKNEVVVLHLLDPAEITLPFSGVHRFIDPETGQRLIIDPDAVRREYRRRMTELIERYRGEILGGDMEYSHLTTDQGLDKALVRFLVHREGLIH